MAIENIIKFLLPSFGRDRIIEDIRITRGELADLIPMYEASAQTFKNWRFASQEVKDSIKVFSNMVGGRDATNPVLRIAADLPKILENLQVVEDLVLSRMGNSVAGKGLTYKQASLIKFVDAAFLVSKYARKYLNFIYVGETAAQANNGADLSDSIPPVEREWLNTKMVDFCNALLTATRTSNETRELLDDVPEIEVAASNASTLKATVGDRKLDPLKLGFVASNYNPIYFVRMLVAEWQVMRHKEAREELTMLQLRKLNLEKLKAGRQDAKLEAQIRVVESRIQDVSYRLAKMEQN